MDEHIDYYPDWVRFCIWASVFFFGIACWVGFIDLVNYLSY